MNYENIEKFMSVNPAGSTVEIKFKTRQAIRGMFVKTPDYTELSKKNLWRIVSEPNIKSFHASKDINLVRIFNGAEFTKLELVS